jgi:hypothetical protein
MALVVSGKLDTLRTETLALLKHADASNLPSSRGVVASGVNACAAYMGEVDKVIEYGEILRGIGRQTHVSLFNPFGDAAVGFGMALQSRMQDGVALLDGAIEAMRAQGLLAFLPRFLTMLGMARSAVGDLDGAIAALDEGYAIGAAHGNVGVPYLRSIKADVLLRKVATLDGDAAAALIRDAECEYRTAITEAQASGARLFELKAATGLARLLRDQGDRVAARDALAPIYGWFTEGLDTNPLIEANALLRELA